MLPCQNQSRCFCHFHSLCCSFIFKLDIEQLGYQPPSLFIQQTFTRRSNYSCKDRGDSENFDNLNPLALSTTTLIRLLLLHSVSHRLLRPVQRQTQLLTFTLFWFFWNWSDAQHLSCHFLSLCDCNEFCFWFSWNKTNSIYASGF